MLFCEAAHTADKYVHSSTCKKHWQ